MRRVLAAGGGGGGGGGGGNGASPGGTAVLPSSWEGVRYGDFYYSGDLEPGPGQDGGEGEGAATAAAAAAPAAPASRKRLRPGSFPVVRFVTVVAQSHPGGPAGSGSGAGSGAGAGGSAPPAPPLRYRYLAIGDSSGFVSLYATEPILSPVARLETSASRRDYLEEADRRKRQCRQQHHHPAPSSSLLSSSSSSAGKASSLRARAQYVPVYDSKRSIASQSPNAIVAIDFACTGRRVAVGTASEVELLDCVTGEMVWSLRTDRLVGLGSTAPGEGGVRMARGPPLRLHCHPTREGGGVIAGYAFGAWDGPKEEEAIVGDVSGPECSPLLHFAPGGGEGEGGGGSDARGGSQVNGIVPFQDGPMAIGPRALAIYDQSSADRILAVVVNLKPSREALEAAANSMKGRGKHQKHPNAAPPQQTQELLLLDSSRPPFQVLSRVVVAPVRYSGSRLASAEAMGQSPGGTYTAVAASPVFGGIRLYRTDGLSHLATYGEGIALHGRQVMWQSIFMFDQGSSGGTLRERQDEVSLRMARPRAGREHDGPSLSSLMLVAVPQAFREPLELCETIHLWDMADAVLGGTKLPSATLLAPTKSHGISSLLYDDRRGTCLADGSPASGGGRFILSTQSGDCAQMGPKLFSEWPGKMFAPGYIALDDNIDYVEDEDELDIVVDSMAPQTLPDTTMHVDLESIKHRKVQDESMEFDLKAAVEQSLIDDHVDVINDSESDDGTGLATEYTIISARPDHHLAIRDGESDPTAAVKSSLENASSDSFNVMQLLPQVTEAQTVAKTNSNLEAAVDGGNGASFNEFKASLRPQKKKNRKVWEDEFYASLDSELFAAIKKREVWSDGSGTALQPKSFEKGGPPRCEACHGRAVYHQCCLRVIPEDYEAIARAEAEQKAKEEEEKVKAKREKTRLRDRQRREVAKKKKMDEEAKEKEAKERAEMEKIERELQKEKEDAGAKVKKESDDTDDMAKISQKMEDKNDTELDTKKKEPDVGEGAVLKHETDDVKRGEAEENKSANNGSEQTVHYELVSESGSRSDSPGRQEEARKFEKRRLAETASNQQHLPSSQSGNITTSNLAPQKTLMTQQRPAETLSVIHVAAEPKVKQMGTLLQKDASEPIVPMKSEPQPLSTNCELPGNEDAPSKPNLKPPPASHISPLEGMDLAPDVSSTGAECVSQKTRDQHLSGMDALGILGSVAEAAGKIPTGPSDHAEQRDGKRHAVESASEDRSITPMFLAEATESHANGGSAGNKFPLEAMPIPADGMADGQKANT